MAGKKFKFRVGTDGKSGIKEVVTRSAVVSGRRVDVSLGVTSDFQVAPLNIFQNNIMVPLGTQKISRSKGKTAIYYPIDGLSYIVTVTLIFKGNQIKNKKLTIYIPRYLVSSDEIYCERVTGSFTAEEKNSLLEQLLLFVKSRI